VARVRSSQRSCVAVPPSVTLIALPSECPELNPVESGSSCATNLVDHWCEARKKLTDQPWRITSIGLRQWAHVS
jgi:hypothetical protein